MPVPTEAEWGDYEADLDQKYAHKMFAGRTNQVTGNSTGVSARFGSFSRHV